MANSFFKNGDKAYSENLNDGILVGNAFDWTVTVSLPADTGAVFPNSSTVVKGKVADLSITPNSNLSIGSTISNSSGSSQVYRLTVYPAFNRFGGFKSISVTGDCTFYIANKGGTSPIANNLDYSDLSDVPELKVLKEYDIVLTIANGKSVSGLEFVFQSSSADVSGIISQSCVDGLVADVARIGALETSASNVVNIDLTTYTPRAKIGDTVTIRAKATDINGDIIKNKELTLLKNGASPSNQYTNNQGVATWTVSMTESGAIDFSVNEEHVFVGVTGFESIKSDTNHHYNLYVDKLRRVARINIVFSSDNVVSSLSEYEISSFVPSDYKPTHNIIRPITRDGKIYCYIWGSGGTIGISNGTSSTYNLTCDVDIEYHY